MILCVISCGREINFTAFEELREKTVNIYILTYSLYYMPQSLHKILIHRLTIIQNFSIPIGLLSEEAQEAKNKEFKKVGESLIRKCLRVKTNEDLMMRLLCLSDSHIAVFL